MAVAAPASASSSPPTSGRARNRWLRTLSMRLARSHPARGGLPATLRPNAEGEPSDFHVSTCAEVISPTPVGLCGRTQCLLHTAVFEWRPGEVAHLRSKRGDDRVCQSQMFWNFVSKVMQFTFKGCWRGVSTSRCCIGRGHTHIQSRTASWDSSDSEKIGRSGLCFCESSGFCGDAWVRNFQSTFNGVNACVVSCGGFGGSTRFCVLQLGGPGRIHTNDTGRNPSNPCCRVFCALW